jgi:hypothetical protein
LLSFSDNHSEAILNGEKIMEDGGAANDIARTSRLDDRLQSGRNVLSLMGWNAPPASANPNPWRFGFYLEDYRDGEWLRRGEYECRSASYPQDSPPPGVYYDVTIWILAD